ncbi:MAG: serine/threonine protein kinase, partial [Candidatus Aminicenantes bacterium]
MGIKCPKCQFDNPDDSKFCKECGTQIIPSEEIPVTKTFITPSKGLDEGSTIIGKYRIIEKLGEGGMGVVYKAEDQRLKRTVGLKFMPPEFIRDPEAKQRFVREAQAAAALVHPNICTIHEIDEEEGKSFIAMEYIEGQSIREKIKKGPLNLTETLDIAIQAAQGLEEAHKKGIIHRDIKSANIMVTETGLAKIMDFGLAKVKGASLITKEATTMGTVAYMSPEQARGEELDERTDIWSLGVILYEMISGNLPFRGANDQSIVFSILNEDPAPVKELEKGIPVELEKIMRRALSKHMTKRFSSASEMVVTLQELKAKLIEGETLTTIQMIFRKPRKRLLIGGIIGIVTVAVVFLTWIFTRPTLAFNIQDKLLVADVDNQTGDSVFDMALRTAIEADLQQSPYVSIFDKAQMAETLRLMRMDPSLRIDENLGYDICRFSGIRAMILPRILAAGEAFELQAILIDPRRKRHVDRIRVTALGREEVLLNAIDKLARQVRSRLGESLKSIEKADKPVAQHTTSSWEALHYLSMGQA